MIFWKSHRHHSPQVDEVDVTGQVSRHRLVGVHQAVPLEVIRQVDHPVEKDRN